MTERGAMPPSRVAFAVVMIGIGLWGFAQSAFVAVWAPGIQPPEVRGAVALSCAAISTACGAGLLWERTARVAAQILFAWLILWLVWCKGAALLHAPADFASWESLGETAVIGAAAAALAASGTNALEVAGARVVYGLAMIAFGAAHFGYATMTASLVPGWLPWHLAWVYLTGATYIAAGVALVIDRAATAAATLSALQMGLFGVLVWLPKILAGAGDPDTLNETAISFALAVSGWVVATALRGRAQQEERAGRSPTLSLTA